MRSGLRRPLLATDRTGWAGLALVLATLVSACGPAATGGPPPGSSAGTGSAPSAVPASPVRGPEQSAAGGSGVDARATLDEATAVRQMVGVEGGTLETADAAGTRYQLAIPAGVVLSPVEISMTPIASMTGLPFSGPVVAGVILEPDGLQLAGVARLSISGPGIDASLEPFAFHGTGRDVHRWMVLPGDAIVMPVLHFSGGGLARTSAGPAEWSPADPLAKAVHDAAAAANEARKRGDSEGVVDALVAGAQAALTQHRATLPRALADPLGYGSWYVPRLLELARLLSILGAEPDMGALLGEIEAIFGAAADELARRCRDRSHDPSATWIRALAIRRQAELLGVWSRDLSLKLKGVDPCLRYRLFVEPTIELVTTPNAFVEGNVDDEDILSTYVAGRQKLTWHPGEHSWRGTFPIAGRDQRWTDDCWTGQPFELRGGDGTLGGATIEVRVEASLVTIAPAGPDGIIEDDATILTGTVRLDGYALVPVSDADRCFEEDFLLSDVGGAFAGAGGTAPFTVPVKGGEVVRAGEGRALLRPPGTSELLDTADRARYAATYRFTSDTEASSDLDGAFDFAE